MQTFLKAVLLFLTWTSLAFAQTTSDYLILQDIGPYKLDRPEKILPGRPPIGGPEIYNNNPGIVGPVDHFALDHNDTTYKVMYIGGNGNPSPTVFVTRHSGTDSDKWLQHELDIEFRNYFGMPGYYIKTINGNTVYVYGAGGRDYRWLSGGKVIMIEYHDSQLTKPEPLEVIQAYLSKHPSTLPVITTKDVMSKANEIAWIKDEMDRRLWLCDKWFAQLAQGTVKQFEVLQQVVTSMNVFLDYREKYYGIKAVDEKNLIVSYWKTGNAVGLTTKLAEYKSWWSANKAGSINLT